MAADPNPRSERPLRIGRYQIERRIGAGGMGAVYRAKDTELGREVALKILPPQLAAKPEMLERFRQEAMHAAKLRHENIVTLYECGESGGAHYLVMEYVDGVNLHEYIDQHQRLDPEEARQLLIQSAKALALAHQSGIIHRDIKPSNFLLTRKDGQPLVKLTDFGLARATDAEEFKITRSGTTVGTVDYIAPEQARNSRAADVRSDIYSLGCMLYHMLAGQPPFPEGDLTERLLKHVEAEPADVRNFNPKVPPGLVVVLQRMMAKKPEDRYPSAEALLKDLEHLPAGPQLSPRELLEALALDPKAKAPPRKPAASKASQPALGVTSPFGVPATPPKPPKLRYRQSRARSASSDRAMQTAAYTGPIVIAGWKAWAVTAAAVAGVSLVLIAILLGWGVVSGGGRAGGRSSGPRAAGVSGEPRATDKSDVARSNKSGPGQPQTSKTSGSVDAQRRPSLNRPSEEVQSALSSEFVARSLEVKPDAVLRSVSRLGPGATIAAICAAEKGTNDLVIEIADNGPLFEPPVAVSGRNLIIRAAAGYRPLLAWDLTSPSSAAPGQWISVADGNLTLANIDLVARVTETQARGLDALVRVNGGDFRAENCTFSVAGTAPTGLAALRFEGARTDKLRSQASFSRCYLRGSPLTAVQLITPGAQVFLEDSIVLTGAQPAFSVQGSSSLMPMTIRALRSTICVGQTLLRLRPASAGDLTPALGWLAWDSLLAIHGSSPGSAILDLQPGTSTADMQWRSVNCLYTGWERLLLGGPGDIRANDLPSWRNLWHQNPGDEIAPSPWPPALTGDLAQVPVRALAVGGTFANFAATSSAGSLGADVAKLPPSRDTWPNYVYARSLTRPWESSAADAAPEIPSTKDGRYHGERLDPTGLDLGQHLAQMGEKMGLGQRIVLHLTGKGTAQTSPLQLKGASLVLWFEPASAEANRLTLSLRPGIPAQALVQVEGGGCEIVGGRLKMEVERGSTDPAFLIQVQGGDVHLLNTRLEMPGSATASGGRGLIQLTGSGEVAADQVRDCLVQDSVLTSCGVCLKTQNSGVSVRWRNSVAVSDADLFLIEPPARPADRLNHSWLFEHCTLAPARAAFRLRDTNVPNAVEPIVVQARQCIFRLSSADSQHGALVEGEGQALVRGLLAWQGDGNLVADSFPRWISAGDASVPNSAYARAQWLRFVGPLGERRPMVYRLAPPTRSQGHFALETLALPTEAMVPSKTARPGADFTQLGLIKH